MKAGGKPEAKEGSVDPPTQGQGVRFIWKAHLLLESTGAVMGLDQEGAGGIAFGLDER